MTTSDRNVLPRHPQVQSDYRTVAYTGATPGADSTTYVLFNSTSAPEFAASSPFRSVFVDFRRYVLTLKNSQAGVLNAYGSMDNGVNWYQISTQAVTASAGTASNTVYIPIEPHLAFKVEWVNGGSAQGTWVVAQALDGEESVASTGGGGGGGAVTVTSGTLTANQGTAGTAAQGWFVRNTDGTNVAAVKAASTAAVAADPALVVAVSPNNQVQGQTAALSVANVAQAQDVLPLGKYNATPPTLTDLQLLMLQLDANGYLKGREQYAPVAEDNTNGVIATRDLPVAVSTYCYSVALSVALTSSVTIKATSGVIRSISGRIDSTATSGTYYVMLWNLAAVPANATAVSTSNSLMAPYKIVHTSGTDDRFSFDFTVNGTFASTAITIGLSSTEFTQTAAGAFLSITGEYK